MLLVCRTVFMDSLKIVRKAEGTVSPNLIDLVVFDIAENSVPLDRPS